MEPSYVYFVTEVTGVGVQQLSWLSAEQNSFELPVVFDQAEYKRWLDRRLDELVAEAQQAEKDYERRVGLASRLQFPFANPRSGQMDIVDKIERVLLTGDALLCTPRWMLNFLDYVFSPVSLLGRLTTAALGATSKPNLIIDEAHNLPARACDYFSPQISSQTLDACHECLESLPLDLRLQARAAIRECFALMASYQPRTKDKQCVIQPEKEAFEKLNQVLGRLLKRICRR